MASRTVATAALFIALNLVFLTMVSSTECPPPPPKKPHTPSKPHPSPSPSPSKEKCPRNALKLNVCADLLGGAVHIAIPEKSKCCSLLKGLVDLEAAVCLCTAIKANVLGINLTLPIDLSLFLNPCGRKLPPGFKC